MDASLWFGALATLAGAALGGLISYVLSRQQIRAARAQQLEAERAERSRRSQERRLDIYADFLARARAYRNAIRRPSRPESVPLQKIRETARTADAAGSLVHLVSRSPRTALACGDVMRTMGNTSEVLHTSGAELTDAGWDELNKEMSQALRSFQAAARAELGIDDNAGG